MRTSAALIGAIVALAVALIPTVAEAEGRKRVALFHIDGDGSGAVTDDLSEILQRACTVVSNNAIARSKARRKVAGRLADRDYASLAADLSVDAVVLGKWLKAGRQWRLTLTVRDGRTGGRVTDLRFAVRPRRGALDAASTEEVAAKLLPVIEGISSLLVEASDGAAMAPAEPTSNPAPPAPAPAATAAEITSDAAPASAPASDPAPAPGPAPAEDEPDTAASRAAKAAAGGLGPISGKAFAYLRAAIDGDPFQQVSSSLWLSARPELTDASYARFEIALDAFDVSLGGNRRLRASLREGYVALRTAGWLLRIGQQIIPWGSADVVNPTDFLTARDFTYFAADTEQARVGAISVLASKAWSFLEITAVATPSHPVSTLLVPPSALPAGVTLAPAAPRELRVEDTEVAGKIKLSGSSWDLAVVGFRGHNHVPELALVSLDGNGAVLRQTHHRIRAAGIDGSARIGEVVVRAEGSYVETENRDGAEPTIQPTFLHGVLGLERPVGDHLRLQAQLVARFYPKWRDPGTATGPDEATTQVMRGIAASNALLLDYQDRRPTAATVRAAYTSDEGKLEVEVFAAINVIGRDYLVRPLASWHPTDAVTVQVGLEAYGGKASRPLGALAPFGGAFTQVSFAF